VRYLFVLVASLAAGVVAYAVSLRAPASEPGPRPRGPEPAGQAVPAPPPGYTYLQVVVTHGPSLPERIQGLLGSLALVAIAAVALALSLYAVGAMIGRLLRSYLGQ
jgi:hypothetical protein